MLRTLLVILAASASMSVDAMPDATRSTGVNGETRMVERSFVAKSRKLFLVAVMRDFDKTVALGNDPVTGEERYPHRSVKLDYKADCNSNKVAVSEWAMFAGNLGDGEVVWAQKTYGKLAFLAPVNEEMRAVLNTACASTTVLR